jgi:hypothetical protein
MSASIDRELLNNQLVAIAPVHTGVYLSHQRRSAVVVRVKQGHVHYLTFLDCQVQVHESFTEKFLRDYPLELYRYPALRALRQFVRYVRLGFKITPEAKVLLRAILAK